MSIRRCKFCTCLELYTGDISLERSFSTKGSTRKTIFLNQRALVNVRNLMYEIHISQRFRCVNQFYSRILIKHQKIKSIFFLFFRTTLIKAWRTCNKLFPLCPRWFKCETLTVCDGTTFLASKILVQRLLLRRGVRSILGFGLFVCCTLRKRCTVNLMLFTGTIHFSR